jgi:hypothetical protein
MKSNETRDVMSFPYVMKRGFSGLVGLFLPLTGCFGLLTFILVTHQWRGLFVVLPILAGLGFVLFSYANRRITLNQENIRFENLSLASKVVSYTDITKIEIVSGGKIAFLELQTITEAASIRIGLEPYSKLEWAKFISVISQQSPNTTLGAKAERWRRKIFY